MWSTTCKEYATFNISLRFAEKRTAIITAEKPHSLTDFSKTGGLIHHLYGPFRERVVNNSTQRQMGNSYFCRRMIPKETVDKIFESAIIEEVIADFVELKKSGSSLKGLSPFTSEKTPSFYVVPHKGIFKDFSSGKGGNVVNFLMEHEKMTYPEALKWLAGRYNIEIVEELTPEQEEIQTDRESLGVLTQYAQKYFEGQLFENEEGRAIGLSYFVERGFREDVMKKFGLGYCPDHWDTFSKKALEDGYAIKYLLSSGLSKDKDRKPYDFFRGRVMFPIRNVSGKVIAFGGRTLRSDKKIAKYVNSPESELYIKNQVLYGIDLAKREISNRQNCYLVEGYTDVISLHQAGVENVVASAGTSLTDGQIKAIGRFAKKITILYDGDAAGIRASFRGIEMILKQNLEVEVVMFPEGEDPDSYARKVSSSELQEYLDKEAKNFIGFKTGILLEEAKGDPIKRAELIRDIVGTIAIIPDAISRTVYIQQCSSMLEIGERTLHTEVNKIMRSKLKKSSGSYVPDLPPPPPPPQEELPKKELAILEQEKDFVRLLLTYGRDTIKIGEGEEEMEVSMSEFLIHEIDTDEIVLEHESLQRIVRMYRDELNEERFPEDEFFSGHEDSGVREAALELLLARHELSDNWKKHRIYAETEDENLRRAAYECVARLKLRHIQRMMKKIEESLKDTSLDSEKMELLWKEKMKLDRAKTSLSETVGTVIL
jgi:DNA primase